MYSRMHTVFRLVTYYLCNGCIGMEQDIKCGWYSILTYLMMGWGACILQEWRCVTCNCLANVHSGFTYSMLINIFAFFRIMEFLINVCYD